MIKFILFFVLSCNLYAITFKYNGDVTDQVYLMSDLNKWGEIPWQMFPNPDGQFSYTIPTPFAKKIRYKFRVNNRWINDPLNSSVERDGMGGLNSLLETQFEENPLLFRYPSTPNWIVETFHFNYKKSVRKILYLHPSKEIINTGRKVITLYFQDGADYLNFAHVKTLLENLSEDKSLPLFEAVMIPPLDRFKEYTFDLDYASFVANDLVDYLGPSNPDHRILIGASLGGLANLFISHRYPQIFPNVAVQSSSCWFANEKILKLYSKSKIMPKKVYLSWGSFESEDIQNSNKKMFKLLSERGVNVHVQKHPAIHNWTYWRNSLEELLRHSFN